MALKKDLIDFNVLVICHIVQDLANRKGPALEWAHWYLSHLTFLEGLCHYMQKAHEQPVGKLSMKIV